MCVFQSAIVYCTLKLRDVCFRVCVCFRARDCVCRVTLSIYVAYEIAVTFLIQPHVYFGLTAIFLAFNLCPVIIIIAFYSGGVSC